MDFINDLIDSIPIIGPVKAGIHLMAGDSNGAKKAFIKSTRSTAAITGGTVGFMMGGPGGAIAGTIYGGTTVDTIATAATEEEHGYIKHTADFVREVADGNFPLKPAVRAGLQLGFDVAGGKGMNVSCPNSICDMTSSVGKQIYKKSLGMDQGAFCKKFTKHAIKHDVEMALKLIPDNRAIEKEKGRKKKSKKKFQKMVDSDSDYDLSSDSEYDSEPRNSRTEVITYRAYPYYLKPEYFLYPFPFGFDGSRYEYERRMDEYYRSVYQYYQEHPYLHFCCHPFLRL